MATQASHNGLLHKHWGNSWLLKEMSRVMLDTLISSFCRGVPNPE
jgi:protein associated with RNAse G/E